MLGPPYTDGCYVNQARDGPCLKLDDVIAARAKLELGLQLECPYYGGLFGSTPEPYIYYIIAVWQSVPVIIAFQILK